MRYREKVFLLDNSLCEHHTDQNSNKTLHDPSCPHSTPGWIQFILHLDRLYIHLFGPISAELLSKLSYISPDRVTLRVFFHGSRIVFVYLHI